MDEQELCYTDFATLGRLYRAHALSPVEATRIVLDRIRRLDQRLNSFITVKVLGEIDVLLSPAVAWKAPAEDPPVGESQGAIEARRTGPDNLVGLPAISIPCGFGSEGLPLGMQIAAAPLSENQLLRVAYTYEQHAGWFRQHPSLF